MCTSLQSLDITSGAESPSCLLCESENKPGIAVCVCVCVCVCVRECVCECCIHGSDKKQARFLFQCPKQ